MVYDFIFGKPARRESLETPNYSSPIPNAQKSAKPVHTQKRLGPSKFGSGQREGRSKPSYFCFCLNAGSVRRVVRLD